jgi:ubiquinone/menaquinone biosynthesis C-methylase UbiE
MESSSTHASLPSTFGYVLMTKGEINKGTEFLQDRFNTSHHDEQKNWDFAVCMQVVENRYSNARILDAGGGKRAYFSQVASQLPNVEIHSIDLLPLNKDIRKNYPRIIDRVGDLENLPYGDNYFDFIGCLSVIEHVASDQKVLDELFRLLKPGGSLVVSTDYWPEPIDTRDLFPYGPEAPEARIYNQESFKSFLLQAEAKGWIVPDLSFLKFEPMKPVVRWERLNLEYTFVCVQLEKPNE